MDNVLQVEIDEDIVLDESKTVGMPDDIRGRILVTMTIFCLQNDCHWTELTWEVKRDRTIHVKRKL